MAKIDDIKLTNRLRQEDRLPEAMAFHQQCIEKLNARGVGGQEATEQAWAMVVEKYPPIADMGLLAGQKKLEGRLKKLPPNASRELEDDWIAAHRLMLTSHDQRDTRVTVKDVDAAHGPAPSQAAVNLLQFFANHPQLFFKQYQDKRKAGGKGDGGCGAEPVTVRDPTLVEVEKMISDFGAAG